MATTRKYRVPLAVAAIVVIAVIGAGAWYLSGSPAPEPGKTELATSPPVSAPPAVPQAETTQATAPPAPPAPEPARQAEQTAAPAAQPPLAPPAPEPAKEAEQPASVAPPPAAPAPEPAKEAEQPASAAPPPAPPAPELAKEAAAPPPSAPPPEPTSATNPPAPAAAAPPPSPPAPEPAQEAAAAPPTAASSEPALPNSSAEVAPQPPTSAASPPAEQSAAPPAAPAAETPAPTKLALAPGAIRSVIAAAAAPVGCAMVKGEVAEAGGTVTLSGLAGQGAPEAALHRAITDAAPTAAVDWQVASFDGPYCHALDVLHPVARSFGSAASGFAMTLRGGGAPLKDGELITVDVTMPDYPAFLLLDYFQHDGTVVHLAPAAKDPARSYPAGWHQALGDPATGGERWAVGAPYGTDMMVAVVSSAPLFAQPRKDLEEADAYLRALKAAIESAERRNVRVAADALVLTTKPRL